MVAGTLAPLAVAWLGSLRVCNEMAVLWCPARRLPRDHVIRPGIGRPEDHLPQGRLRELEQTNVRFDRLPCLGRAHSVSMAGSGKGVYERALPARLELVPALRQERLAELVAKHPDRYHGSCPVQHSFLPGAPGANIAQPPSGFSWTRRFTSPGGRGPDARGR